MRMLPTRYISGAKPIRVKKQPAKVQHLTAPLQGLDLSSQLTGNTGGRSNLLAPILKNFVVFEDRIQCRPGSAILATHADHKSIETIIPYFGPVKALLAATNGKLAHCFDMANIRTGFTKNAWSWTSYANLGVQTYTVMVNGADGVWSWDGGIRVDSAAVTITSLSNTNPAVCTVAAADIAKFANGQMVLIAGADATHSAANGYHTIGSVNSPVNTFVLSGVNTSSASGAQTTGVTAVVAGSLVKEPVTAPASAAWVDPNKLAIVMAHQNLLFFADEQNLCVYYLPLQQKSGQLNMLPLNAMFRRGGFVRAIYSWTIDGGAGMDDLLVIFSSNGECAIYKGTDPATDYSLIGVFRFDSPLSKGSVTQYGGELYVLISSGMVPMSTMLRAQTEQIGPYDRKVSSAVYELTSKYRALPGWTIMLDSTTNRAICNMPKGADNKYRQIVRDMIDPSWVQWEDLPSRCWIWQDNLSYFGDDSGNVWQFGAQYLNDNGQPILCDVQWAWSDYGSPAFKQFKMVRPYITTDGVPTPFVDMRADYDQTPPQNQPDISFTRPGGVWNAAVWNTDSWGQGNITLSSWNGVSASGRVAAPRISAAITNCTFAISGIDVLFEIGSVL